MNNELSYYSIHNDAQNINYAFNRVLRKKNIGKDDSTYLTFIKSAEAQYYQLPEESKKAYDKALADENLFRRIGTVTDVSVSTGSVIVTATDGAAEIVPPETAFPDNDDTISESTFNTHKIASMCKLNNAFVRDKNYDIQKYLRNTFARRFGKKEEDVFINGTGTSEPKGILASAEIGRTVVGDDFTADDLIKLYFSLDKHMRKNATWVMSDETALKVRTMKDGAGNYLWKDDTILGRPVEISNYMEDATKPIAFGDFSFFWIIQRSPLSVKVLSELYSLQDKTGYVGYETLDGKLIRSDAIKLLLLEEEENPDSE